jgi:hypothetical protein
MRPRALPLLLSLAACVDKGGDDSAAGVNPCEAPADNGGWPAGVAPACVGPAITADLSAGDALDLAWASNSSVACFPDTEFVNFSGPHLLFWFSQPEQSLLTATATPDDGVDVSVYVLQQGATTYATPPDLQAAVSCEAGYDDQTDSNPGAAEAATVTATTNPYNVLIGVAGAEGVGSGGFTLELTLEQ